MSFCEDDNRFESVAHYTGLKHMCRICICPLDKNLLNFSFIYFQYAAKQLHQNSSSENKHSDYTNNN